MPRIGRYGMGKDRNQHRQTDRRFHIPAAPTCFPQFRVLRDQLPMSVVLELRAEVFEEICQAEKRMTDTGLRPIEKNGALRKSDEVVGIEIEVAERIGQASGLQFE